ncbi:MAG: F0F1 ATP synthase subunit delta [Thiobacillaceae bacterium]
MAELTTLARPYAEAIARLAKTGNSWTAWSDMLVLLAAVSQDAQIAALAEHPEVTQEQLLQVLLAVCSDRLTAEGVNLLRLLVENKRLAALSEIARLFEEMRAAEEGVLEARIVTAYELTPQQLAELVSRLEARFGRKVQATQEVDPGLIGGVVIQVGDEVLDASVRGRLAELAATLTA